MRMPQMILFDYGQTLVAEDSFDGVKGTVEVMRHAIQNKEHRGRFYVLIECSEKEE